MCTINGMTFRAPPCIYVCLCVNPDFQLRVFNNVKSSCTTDSQQCCTASAHQAVPQTVSSAAQPQLTRLYHRQPYNTSSERAVLTK